MVTIKGLLDRIEAIDSNAIAISALKETTDERVELNREQLQSGLRSDGSGILPSYTEETIRIKRLKGQETRFVNLKDTGDWQAGIQSKINGDTIITESIDYKNEKLKRKYETSKGKLMGLSYDFKVDYIEKSLWPTFIKKIRKAAVL